MKAQIFIINRTYVAEDQKTHLRAFGATADEAERKLVELVNEYWQARKIIVPVTKDPKE